MTSGPERSAGAEAPRELWPGGFRPVHSVIPRRKSADKDGIMHSMRTAARLLSVVIPCYNEIGTISQILRRVAESPVVHEIIVVDDCSKDGTRDALQEILAQWPPGHPPLHVL